MKDHDFLYGYYDNIRKEYECSRSILENILLKDIYIEPYVNIYDSKSYTIKDDSVLASTYLKDWYESNTSRVLLLMGEPGHGKSSFCKMTIYDYICKKSSINTCNMFLVRLNKCKNLISNDKKLDIHNVLIDDKIASKNNIPHLKNSLIFLDGYDEIYMTLKDINISTLNFIDALNELSNELNSHIVLTTRKSCIEDIRGIIMRRTNVIELANLTSKQQSDWLTSYHKLNKSNSFSNEHLMYLKENNYKLYELTQIPILFQLIVEFNPDGEINDVVSLYDKIVSDVTINRKDENMINNIYKNTDIKKLLTQLENLSYSIFKNNDNDIIVDRESDIVPVGEISKELVISFYLKNFQNEDEHYNCHIEFIHRSFYQYFLAYYLYNNLKKCIKYNHIITFLELIYIREIDKDVIYFIELIANKKNNITINELQEVINEIGNTECIIDIVDILIKDLGSTKQEIIYNYIKNEKISKFKIFNIIFNNIINIIGAALKNKDFENLDISCTTKCFKYYNIHSINLSKFCLNNKDLSNVNLSNMYLERMHLKGVDLRKANLRKADLTEADLTKASLKRANLKRASLIGTALTGANLTRADLKRAALIYTVLIGANLTGADLTEANLTEADLTEADLTEADLTEADLTKAILKKTHLTKAILERADLTDANLTKATLKRAYLVKANLSNTKLTNANLTEADLTEADLTKTDLTGANLNRAYLNRANLTGANLKGANLKGAKLTEASLKMLDLTKTDLTGANLNRADLNRVNLTGANLIEVTLIEASLKMSDLTEAKLRHAKLTEAKLTKVYLTRATLIETDLSGAGLTEANLTGANLTEAYLIRATLIGANLTEVNLNGSNLTKVNLTKVNLTKATLKRADLTEANLTGANLTGADLTETTLNRITFIEAMMAGASLEKIILENE